MLLRVRHAAGLGDDGALQQRLGLGRGFFGRCGGRAREAQRGDGPGEGRLEASDEVALQGLGVGATDVWRAATVAAGACRKRVFRKRHMHRSMEEPVTTSPPTTMSWPAMACNDPIAFDDVLA